ncbi:MAG: hypothetical protein RIA69_21035 [Cyclobacteriaceae bacterium]
MKYILLAVLVFQLSVIRTTGQDLSKQWLESLSNYGSFQEINSARFSNWDFSQVLSNSNVDGFPTSTYVGVFGPKFRRIDFHLEVSKTNGSYEVTGKSKLGNNIQSLSGKIELIKTLLKTQEYITDSLYIGIFNCTLREPGIKDGDGVFSGTFALVFYRKDSQLQLFKTSSGDEPTFTNTFVGTWKRYNSDVERKVIFSFHAAGLYERLPFCEDLYTFEENDDFLEIKEEYKEYEWQDYPITTRKRKTTWWK